MNFQFSDHIISCCENCRISSDKTRTVNTIISIRLVWLLQINVDYTFNLYVNDFVVMSMPMVRNCCIISTCRARNRFTSDPIMVIHGNNEDIILFRIRYFRSWTHNCNKKNNYQSPISPLSPRSVFSHLVFWSHHSWSVTSRGRGHWYYDVIFVDCSCTYKLAQRRSSLVNNDREYRFLNTRFSQLSV